MSSSFYDPPSYSPINVRGMKSASTPLESHGATDHPDLTPIELEAAPQTPSMPTPTRRLPSILKNSPGKSPRTLALGARVVFSPPTSQNLRQTTEIDLTHEHHANIEKRSRLLDPLVPYVLSLYLQLLLNVVLVGVVFYLGYVFLATIRQDIQARLEIHTMDALHEISLCSREFYRNKCSVENGAKRPPALERPCTMWAKCMNRDPQLIGKSKVLAETIADIVNAFFQPISWKSLVFIVVLLTGLFSFTNYAFAAFRRHNRPGTTCKSDTSAKQVTGSAAHALDLELDPDFLESSQVSPLRDRERKRLL